MEEYVNGSYDAYETYPIGAEHTPRTQHGDSNGHDGNGRAATPTPTATVTTRKAAHPDSGASVDDGPAAPCVPIAPRATRSYDWPAARLDALRRAVQAVRRGQTMPVIAAEAGLTRDTLYKFLRGATLRPAHADSLVAALKRLGLPQS